MEYLCQFCEKSFGRKYNKNRHERKFCRQRECQDFKNKKHTHTVKRSIIKLMLNSNTSLEVVVNITNPTSPEVDSTIEWIRDSVETSEESINECSQTQMRTLETSVETDSKHESMEVTANESAICDTETSEESMNECSQTQMRTLETSVETDSKHESMEASANESAILTQDNFVDVDL